MKPTDKEDSLTGILALEADGKAKIRECLTAEELALLLESKLSGDAEQRHMEHLAQCDICYNEWKLLKEVQIPNPKKNIIPLFKAKSYRYIGSTLAVAATIAVFLNIYQPPISEMVPKDNDTMRVEGQSFEESATAMDSVEEPSALSVEQPMEEKAASSNASKYMQKSKTRGKAERIDTKTMAPVPTMEKSISKPEATPAKRILQSRTQEKEVLLGEQDFSDMVHIGCGQNEYSQDYWNRVIHLAETLMGNEDFEVYSRRKITHAIEAITSMEQATWQQQCHELLDLLVEE